MRSRIASLILNIFPLVGSVVVLFFITNLTSPSEAGPIFVLAVLVILYVVVYYLIRLFVELVLSVTKIIGVTLSSVAIRRSIGPIALGPVLLIGLNTLGNITYAEVALVALLVCLSGIYVYKNSRSFS